MCGIAGLFQSRQRTYSRDEATRIVSRMNDCIAHRGPDSEGVWSDPEGRCVLGQRRLSIIDTSNAGLQPFASGDGRWWITFNGEIYNFEDVRRDLQQTGTVFRGRTDTEVLVEAIARWGVEALHRLDGMYAFAAYDTLTRSMLIARDPFGEKPFYYTALRGGGIAFASELRALESLPDFDATVSMDAVAEMLSFQYVGAPRSIYESARKLPPGHWMRVGENGETQMQRHFDFRPREERVINRSLPDLADELEDILTRSLKRRLFADVPLGAFLSGGVDSSTVCALLRRKLGVALNTYSMGFSGSPESEHEIARLFAQHLGTLHHEQLVEPNTGDFLRNIGRVLDEPNGDSSCLPTYLLAGFARQDVTVALSGDGGDELFGGYGRYISTLEDDSRRVSGEQPDWRPGSTYYGPRILVSTEQYIEELFGFVPPGYMAHLNGLRDGLDAAPRGQLLARLRRDDVNHYMPGAVLPKVDRMSMQHGLEVRTPFLNVELARFAETLPDEMLIAGGRGKLILREIAYRYLPRELIDLPKKGFGLPMSDWARHALLNLATEMLGDEARVLPLFGRSGLARFLERQRSEGGFSTYQVWSLLTLESWLRYHNAKVPELASRRPRRDPAPRQGMLNLDQLSGHVWLASRGDPAEGPGPARHPDWSKAPATLAERVLELAGSDARASAPVSVALPDWGVAPSPEQSRSLAVLDKATLVFVDHDAEGRFDYDELSKLTRFGVARVVFASRYMWGSVQEVELRRLSLGQRVANAGRLVARSLARVSNRKAFRSVAQHRFRMSTNASCRTEEIRGLAEAPDVDHYAQYAVFEGLRQLPPIQNSHEEIGLKAGGRYSIWNKTVVFAPTTPARLYTHPLWVVRRTPAVDQLLQFRSVAAAAAPPTGPDAANLAKADAQHREFTLKVGDPVVVCTHGLPPGGAERQWVYLAVGLRRAGYDVRFVLLDEPTGHNGHYLPLLQAAGVPVEVAARLDLVDTLRSLAADRETVTALRSGVVDDVDRLARLVTLFRRIKPRAVIAQLDDPNLYAGVAALLAGVPRAVLSFRNYNPTHFPYIFKKWYRRAYAAVGASQRVLFTGNFAGANRDYEAWIGLEHHRTVAIPNAVSSEFVPDPRPGEVDEARRALGVEASHKVVLGVFRLSGEKDPLTFLAVCEKLARTVPSLRVFVVGIGPLLASLQSEVEQRGLDRVVSFLGRREDVNVLMTMADLLLLTSRQEGMPNVLLEAQLMGLPVVSTDAGGSRDAVIPGHSGIICGIGDVDALYDASLKILSDLSAASAMGEAGRRNARENFSLEAMGRRYIALFGLSAEVATVATAAVPSLSSPDLQGPDLPPVRAAAQDRVDAETC